MISKYPYVMLVVLAALCVLIGWAARGVSNDVGLGKAMAWGYSESNNVWNRIRVDEQGYVLCHKDVEK